jgi:hypothetical protein
VDGFSILIDSMKLYRVRMVDGPQYLNLIFKVLQSARVSFNFDPFNNLNGNVAVSIESTSQVYATPASVPQ